MRLLEGPLKVPEMTYSTNDGFRSTFEAAHPDVELVHYREPHGRFLEKLQREVTVHSRIFFCEPAEVRLASEEILSKPSFTRTADQLLKHHRGCPLPEEGPRGAEGEATGVLQSLGCLRLCPQGAQRLLE